MLPRLRILLLVAALAACSAPVPADTPAPTRTQGVTLTPFTPGPILPGPTETPAPVRTPTPLPTPTPTPYLYMIAEGDTLIGIAFRFGLTLADLLAANPGIDPQFLTIGDSVIIPLADNPAVAELPTPVGEVVAAGPVDCWPEADGSLWCFWRVTNGSAQTVEGLSARVTVYDREGELIGTKTAIAAVDLLPPGETGPLLAWFPEGGVSYGSAAAELLSAIPVAAGDPRYLSFTTESSVEIDGQVGRVSGVLVLGDEEAAVGQVRVALAALDGAGRVIGVRVLSIDAPPAGGTIPFNGAVYSLAGPVAAVEVLAVVYPPVLIP